MGSTQKLHKNIKEFGRDGPSVSGVCIARRSNYLRAMFQKENNNIAVLFSFDRTLNFSQGFGFKGSEL